jgi:hypothetical protein
VHHAAAAWAAIFAAFHVIWALGWYPLLDGEMAHAAFAVPWKRGYLLVVTAMCVIAVPIALAPATAWGQRLPGRLVYRTTWVGTALLDLRLLAMVLQTGYLIGMGRFRLFVVGHWDWWFVIGAILFTASTWRSRPVNSAARTSLNEAAR